MASISTVISERSARRKRRQRGQARLWAVVRGLIAFVVTLTVLLISAWLGGTLDRSEAGSDRPASSGRAEIRPATIVAAEPLAEPPAPPATRLRRLHRVETAVRASPETGPLEEPLDIVSAEELAGISQAHRSRPIP